MSNDVEQQLEAGGRSVEFLVQRQTESGRWMNYATTDEEEARAILERSRRGAHGFVLYRAVQRTEEVLDW